uniref:Flagellar motor protein MotA n=1 Tax=Gongylonema pulchrum TaxID=637853 RepID=A0A183E2C3_9BILA
LDAERNALDGEMGLNEILKNEILSELAENADAQMLEKIDKNLAQNAQLCRLETRLRMHLERLESISLSNENVDRELIKARIERLKRQIDDQTILRKAFDRRDAESLFASFTNPGASILSMGLMPVNMRITELAD